MDDLQVCRPKDVGVKVKYVSTSFLVKKLGHNFQLATAFNNIGTYAKPSPSRTATLEAYICFITQHRHVIKTNMTNSSFNSFTEVHTKYFGVISLFKGLCVCTGAEMGITGSTEHLNELM